MRSTVFLALFLAIASLFGCATTANEPKQVEYCKDVLMTGSRLPKKVCWNVSEAQAKRLEDQLEMEKLQRYSSETMGKGH